ncbi:pyrroloquinoline quinone biosynthesis peptide chaperone PqqD [Actinomycetospora lemnae]|uniref:Pyrroloquinoline quinone biosynthesis peptide chaperone PqqD n=1 Tax=Actinomycetospora lemnae TaxID=3019891 RepID=A0ABT5SN30_9PSEU|nr:pyrroloquinoline quinone biosynthesis peptide chaperone PqqD [Actinomycetospora sp. DW7H6]MDD7964245.1 pyrroloquinoline quinone biosynthesis peptide chaperone PqqD [Actinomycetospora sp. DW7H6]
MTSGDAQRSGAGPIRTVPRTGRPRLARFVKMRYDKARERQVLLGPETVVVLNPTGADILGLCDGAHSVGDIVDELGRRYDRVVDDEVTSFLERLASRRWVEIPDD